MNGKHVGAGETLTEDQRMRLDDPVNAVIEKTETFEAKDGVRVVTYHHRPGLTKRELFAAMAMQGLLHQPTMPVDGWAKMAVFQADELLKELAK